MKTYPSISFDIDRRLQVYVFDKLDGSHIRAEWSRKNSFYKFGSKNVLMDHNHPEIGEAVELIRSTYEDNLNLKFRKDRYNNATCYFEFYGSNSFAGQHQSEQHCVTLLDIEVHEQGFMSPRDFVRNYENLGIPKLLYVGRVNKEFEKSVHDSILQGMTFEGIMS